MSDLLPYLTNIPALAIDNEGAFAIGLVVGIAIGFIVYRIWRQA